MIALTLPFPPSVNHYWQASGHRRFISKRGMDFRASVAGEVADKGINSLGGSLQVFVSLFPPDKRRRDVDNPIKALLDALQHAGVYDDDSQIRFLSVERKEIQKGGACCVVICEDTGANQ